MVFNSNKETKLGENKKESEISANKCLSGSSLLCYKIIILFSSSLNFANVTHDSH